MCLCLCSVVRVSALLTLLVCRQAISEYQGGVILVRRCAHALAHTRWRPAVGARPDAGERPRKARICGGAGCGWRGRVLRTHPQQESCDEILADWLHVCASVLNAGPHWDRSALACIVSVVCQHACVGSR